MRTRAAVFLGIMAGLLAMGACVTQAGATVYTLSDLNSTVLVEPDTGAGMYSWVVDGTSQLYQQWFWYRVGTNVQESIDTLPVAVTPLGPRALDLLYTGSGFTIEVYYLLTGGAAGSNTSDVAESIRIQNTGSSTLDFHFYQYCDFDLNGTAGDDTVSLVNANTVRQADGSFVLSETVATPPPSSKELAYYANTYNSLNGGVVYDLNNDTTTKTGDVTWAFQWDVSITPGSTFLISKDKNLRSAVPEPVTMFSAFMAISGLGMYIRKRMKAPVA